MKVFGNTVVLYDIDLEIKVGEIFGVIGSSGAGKTTLLNALIGFIRPEKGDVLFRGEYLKSHSHELFTSVYKRTLDIKKAFGFASQHPSLYPNLTVEENLDYFASLYGIPKGRKKRNMKLLLDLMDLTHARKRLVSKLSGGMQRRLDIACALIHDPKVLILDEPTADLDPYLRNHIYKLIKKISRKGTTIIIASHNLTEVEQLVDRIGILNKGKLLRVGTPNELKRKLLKFEQIRIQTFPGKYETISRKIKSSMVERIENTGSELVIYTMSPEKVIHDVLHAIEECKEKLIDLKTLKGTLDDVFIKLAAQNITRMRKQVIKKKG